MQPTISRIQNIANSNYAASASEAAKLRDWQENQNQKAMNFNAAEAAKNRDWQKMMSDTAYQRQVKDLQAAGLNPILAAGNGSGAVVGSGATASGVTSSGAMGSPDTSQSGALVSLLGSVLNAQMQMNAMNTSAMTNLAIAEKNNAMSELVARIHASGSAYAAQLNQEGQNYRQRELLEWNVNHPSNMWGTIASLVGGQSGYSGISARDLSSFILSALHGDNGAGRGGSGSGKLDSFKSFFDGFNSTKFANSLYDRYKKSGYYD